MLDRLRLTIVTAAHLRPVQVANRVWRRLRRPRLDGRGAPPFAPPTPGWVAPIAKPQSLVGARRARFLSVERDLDHVGWRAPDEALLWTYNLHYFDDLVADGAADRRDWHRALLADWQRANPPGSAVAWDPYPISLRLVNLAKAHRAGLDLSAFAGSIADQARWLDQSLEHHIQANHLFANAKALLFAGALFDGDEAAGWRRRGLALALRELDEQWLADGAHYELSPMYHALLAEDLADLYNLARGTDWGATLAGRIAARWPAILGWLDFMVHPDGEIAFFNDAAFGIAPTRADLHAYAARLGLPEPVTPRGLSLPSGYARLEAPGACLIADLAAVGPAHQPGHAHADTLSFELSLGGRRVVVNGGTSLYGDGPERAAQRATDAHATLELDGVSSSEVWAGFRVARRARVIGRTLEGGVLAGAHDGYRALRGSPVHARRWTLGEASLLLEDELRGRAGGGHVARIVLPLHPDLRATREADEAVRLSLPGGGTVRFAAEAPIAIEDGHWHPRFGEDVPAQRLVVTLEGARPMHHRLTITWNLP